MLARRVWMQPLYIAKNCSALLDSQSSSRDDAVRSQREHTQVLHSSASSCETLQKMRIDELRRRVQQSGTAVFQLRGRMTRASAKRLA